MRDLDNWRVWANVVWKQAKPFVHRQVVVLDKLIKFCVTDITYCCLRVTALAPRGTSIVTGVSYIS